jgi:hypothetical protein
LLFEKCFFATFLAGKGGEEGRTLSSQLGVRGFSFSLQRRFSFGYLARLALKINFG